MSFDICSGKLQRDILYSRKNSSDYLQPQLVLRDTNKNSNPPSAWVRTKSRRLTAGERLVVSAKSVLGGLHHEYSLALAEA